MNTYGESNGTALGSDSVEIQAATWMFAVRPFREIDVRG